MYSARIWLPKQLGVVGARAKSRIDMPRSCPLESSGLFYYRSLHSAYTKTLTAHLLTYLVLVDVSGYGFIAAESVTAAYGG